MRVAIVEVEPGRLWVKNFAKDVVARLWQSQWLDLLPGYCVSFTAHLVALLVLAMIVVRLAPNTREITPVEVFGNDASDGVAEAIDSVPLSVDVAENRHDQADV
jgi:hypothetical protein